MTSRSHRMLKWLMSGPSTAVIVCREVAEGAGWQFLRYRRSTFHMADISRCESA